MHRSKNSVLPELGRLMTAHPATVASYFGNLRSTLPMRQTTTSIEVCWTALELRDL